MLAENMQQDPVADDRVEAALWPDQTNESEFDHESRSMGGKDARCKPIGEFLSGKTSACWKKKETRFPTGTHMVMIIFAKDKAEQDQGFVAAGSCDRRTHQRVRCRTVDLR